MFGYRCVRAAAARRAPSLLGLVGALALATLGSPAPTGVAAAPPPEPSARLEVVVKSVVIHDDREGFLSGEGEMSVYAGVWRCKEGILPPCGGGGGSIGEGTRVKSMPGYFPHPIIRSGRLFRASSGDTVTLDHPVPGPGDVTWGADTSPELGFAVTAGQTYILQFDMEEFDGDCSSNCNEDMGYTYRIIDTGGHGLGLGTHTVRSRRDEGGATPGDFTVTYEIRRVPLPDLKPVNIKVFDLPGSAKKQVCMAVQNVEVGHARPFEVALNVNDGPVLPGGRYTVGLLASGTHFDACVNVALPTSGRHTLKAVVDEPRNLFEFNEANNVYEQQYQAPESAGAPAAGAPTATPMPSAALPDLVVTAIKVNGRVPDGKDDCKDGKNDVTVIVKNQGPETAGDFFVQLLVDDDQGSARQQGLGSLDAGKEAPLTFKGVTLKKGPHTLAATADWTTGIAESNETNNERQVTASCKDDD